MIVAQLDPELAEALADFPDMNIWENLPAARALYAEKNRQIQENMPEVESVIVEERLIPRLSEGGDVPVRIYSPAKPVGKSPVLLWVHGGGYVAGSAYNDDYRFKQMVEVVGCIIVSIEYRLAPEYPFPASLEDCYSVLVWLSTGPDVLRIDPSRIAIGGISAGGGLASALALLARDRGEVTVIFQMLLCPMIDDRNITASSYAITDARVWNRECNLNGWRAYLGPDSDTDNISPYAAVARAKDLRNLPPAYISTGTIDLFVDENIEYAQRLIRSGVLTELHLSPGGFHAFEYMVPDAAISKRARAMHCDALKRALFA